MKHISQNRGKTKPLQRRIFYYAFSVRRWNCNCKGSAWTVIVLNAHSFGRVCTDRDLRIRIFPFFRKVAVQACHLLRTALFLGLDGILEPWNMNQNHQSNSGQRLIQKCMQAFTSSPVSLLSTEKKIKDLSCNVSPLLVIRGFCNWIGRYFFYRVRTLSSVHVSQSDFRSVLCIERMFEHTVICLH